MTPDIGPLLDPHENGVADVTRAELFPRRTGMTDAVGAELQGRTADAVERAVVGVRESIGSIQKDRKLSEAGRAEAIVGAIVAGRVSVAGVLDPVHAQLAEALPAIEREAIGVTHRQALPAEADRSFYERLEAELRARLLDADPADVAQAYHSAIERDDRLVIRAVEQHHAAPPAVPTLIKDSVLTEGAERWAELHRPAAWRMMVATRSNIAHVESLRTDASRRLDDIAGETLHVLQVDRTRPPRQPRILAR